jgi:FAD/FMN-containing dehydrogenase
MTPYEAKKTRLLDDLAAARAQGGATIGLAKPTSNLFRDRAARKRPRVDLSHFNTVLNVDAAAGTVEAEGMTTFVDLADATLAAGTVPCVVPQLKSITLGGAVAGVGIEASSFQFGLVHDTISEIEVLTGDGRALVCTPDNEYRDLFHGLPNSYGTLGYALKLTARTAPARRYVHLEHRRYADPAACFAAMDGLDQAPGVDFLDGVVFAPDALVLTLGRFVDSAPYTSDYTFERMYYQSLRERTEDYLATRDYLWRWDTDWFWCSQNLGLRRRWLRRLFGRRRLNSVTYQKIMRWNSRWRMTQAWDRLRGLHPESVIQDVDIPFARAADFLEFLRAQIGILPIWLCPIRAPDPRQPFPLYPLAPGAAYVNFGFWDTVRSREPHAAGFYNRMIEHKVTELGGLKSLYSDSYFTPDEFWAIYNRPAYDALKRKYDPDRALPDLYEKCVLRH